MPDTDFIGTTAGVSFDTVKDCWTTDPAKCHFNLVPQDSDWETIVCQKLEEMDEVRAYAKNQGLDFRIPYTCDGRPGNYLPDLIVKLDDIGLHMAQRRSRTTRRLGAALVRIVPRMLTALAAIGTAAMLWVGGGILLHGIEELHLGGPIPHLVNHVAHAAEPSAKGPHPGISHGLRRKDQ